MLRLMLAVMLIWVFVNIWWFIPLMVDAEVIEIPENDNTRSN